MKLQKALTHYGVRIGESAPDTSTGPFPGTEFVPPAGPGPNAPPPGVSDWVHPTLSSRVARSLWSERNLLDSKINEFGWDTEKKLSEDDRRARQALRTLVASFDTATEQLMTAITLAEERDGARISSLLPVPNGSIALRDLVHEYLDVLAALREFERHSVARAPIGPTVSAESWSVLKGKTTQLDATLRSMGLQRMTVRTFESYVKEQSN